MSDPSAVLTSLPPIPAYLYSSPFSPVQEAQSLQPPTTESVSNVFDRFPSPQFLFPGFLGFPASIVSEPGISPPFVFQYSPEFPQNPVPCYTAQVGPISLEARRAKIERYKWKRERRYFGKKISYFCRKKVADKRLRIKGRFVTKETAAALRGLENSKNNVSLRSIAKAL